MKQARTEKKKSTGCIGKYDTSMCETAKIYVGAGATLAQLAQELDILPSTLSKWRLQHPEFNAAIEEGTRLFTDLRRIQSVEKALWARATGQTVIEDMLEPDPDDATKLILKRRVKKTVPGSFDAQSFFLTNRAPERWSVKPQTVETKSTGEVVHTVSPEVAELLGRIHEQAADKDGAREGEG